MPKFFRWSQSEENRQCKIWWYNIQQKLREFNLGSYIETPNKRLIQQNLEQAMSDNMENTWVQDLNRHSASTGTGRNKLRTYRTFKSQYKTEPYLNCIMPKTHRSAYAKFRCGMAPIRLETGRYERLDESDRTCFQCPDMVENEQHVLLACPLYNDIRLKYLEQLQERSLTGLNNEEKIKFIMSSYKFDIIRLSAKICFDVLRLRRQLLYQS